MLSFVTFWAWRRFRSRRNWPNVAGAGFKAEMCRSILGSKQIFALQKKRIRRYAAEITTLCLRILQLQAFMPKRRTTSRTSGGAIFTIRSEIALNWCVGTSPIQYCSSNAD